MDDVTLGYTLWNKNSRELGRVATLAWSRSPVYHGKILSRVDTRVHIHLLLTTLEQKTKAPHPRLCLQLKLRLPSLLSLRVVPA